MKNVVGLFDNMQDAEAAVRELRDAGIADADISYAGRNADSATMEANDYVADGNSEAAEGAGFGATGGTVVGGLTGLLVGLGALAIPGVGPVIAAGSLATALGSAALGAGIGAATGGLLGALVGAGIPEEDANVYSEGIRRGGQLVMARVDDTQVENALDIMERNNVVDIDERGAEFRTGGWTRYDENVGAAANDASYGTTTGTSAAGVAGTTNYSTRDLSSDTGTMGGGYNTTGASYTGTTDPGYAANSGTTGTDYSGTGDADRVPDSGDYARSSGVGTAGGTLAGAATGAAIGSAGGPIGTVVGGVAGAVTGGGVGAAGDAAGAEMSDSDAGTTGSYDSSRTGTGTTYGSATNTGSTMASGMGTTRRSRMYDAGGSTMTGSTSSEGAVEGTGSQIGNVAERGLNTDLDRDGDVGRRDPSNI